MFFGSEYRCFALDGADCTGRVFLFRSRSAYGVVRRLTPRFAERRYEDSTGATDTHRRLSVVRAFVEWCVTQGGLRGYAMSITAAVCDPFGKALLDRVNVDRRPFAVTSTASSLRRSSIRTRGR